MKRSNNSFLNLESLEDRLTPAFDFFYNPAGDIWTVTQVQDDGDATVTVDAITNDLVIDDGAGGPVTVGVALGSLTINLMDNSSGDLTVELDEFLFGNVSINLGNGGDFDGDGVRDLTLNGASNFIGGNLRMTGGTGDQSAVISGNVALSVGGSTYIEFGLGDDSVTTDGDVSIGGNLTLVNVNQWNSSDTVTVGGSVSMNVRLDNIFSAFDLVVGGATVIGGNFTYYGGNGEDNAFLSNDVIIGGSVNINLGNDVLGVDDQEVDMSGATIGGNVTIIGGTITGFENIDTDINTVIGGNIYINTGTLGDTGDDVDLQGTIGGRSVTIITSINDDTVSYNMTGNNPRLFASLGLGDDDFTLGADVDLSYLYIDFGFGSDSYTTLFPGPYTFRVYLRNLP